jgi:hypothetical protein
MAMTATKTTLKVDAQYLKSTEKTTGMLPAAKNWKDTVVAQSSTTSTANQTAMAGAAGKLALAVYTEIARAEHSKSIAPASAMPLVSKEPCNTPSFHTAISFADVFTSGVGLVFGGRAFGY